MEVNKIDSDKVCLKMFAMNIVVTIVLIVSVTVCKMISPSNLLDRSPSESTANIVCPCCGNTVSIFLKSVDADTAKTETVNKE